MPENMMRSASGLVLGVTPLVFSNHMSSPGPLGMGGCDRGEPLPVEIHVIGIA